MRPGPARQAGATLIVALLMLTVLAVLAVNTVNESTVDLRIVSNMQGRMEAQDAVQDALEQVISDKGNFSDPRARTISIPRPGYRDSTDTGTIANIDVDIAIPVCRGAVPAEGYSATTGPPIEDTVWELTASVTDPLTGARTEVHQGVALIMRLGSCPEH